MIWDILWVYRFIISFLSLVNQFRDKARFPNLDIGKQPERSPRKISEYHQEVSGILPSGKLT